MLTVIFPEVFSRRGLPQSPIFFIVPPTSIIQSQCPRTTSGSWKRILCSSLCALRFSVHLPYIRLLTSFHRVVFAFYFHNGRTKIKRVCTNTHARTHALNWVMLTVTRPCCTRTPNQYRPTRFGPRSAANFAKLSAIRACSFVRFSGFPTATMNNQVFPGVFERFSKRWTHENTTSAYEEGVQPGRYFNANSWFQSITASPKPLKPKSYDQNIYKAFYIFGYWVWTNANTKGDRLNGRRSGLGASQMLLSGELSI